MELKDLVSRMDLAYLSSCGMKMGLDEFFKEWKNGNAILLDVRTKEETKLLSFKSFGIEIPMNELPSRLNEIPKDKTVVVACPGVARAVISLIYLKTEGMKNVKLLNAHLSDLVAKLRVKFVKELVNG